MKTLIAIAFLFFGFQLSAQISLDPNKIKEKAKKEVNEKTKGKTEKIKEETEPDDNKQQINRKRPGGTVQKSPSSTQRSGEGEKKKKGGDIEGILD